MLYWLYFDSCDFQEILGFFFLSYKKAITRLQFSWRKDSSKKFNEIKAQCNIYIPSTPRELESYFEAYFINIHEESLR